jgi:hypothetical protein
LSDKLIRASILASLFAVAILSFAMVLPAVAAQSSGQYVTYSVTATNSTRTISATVNETIASSSKSGFSIVTLELASSMSNLTYSKLVNSSEALFPVIPPIGNQSFTYQIHNYSISASVSQISGGSVTFDGVSYSTTNYAFAVSVSNASGGLQTTASGQLSALPSGLLYSAVINANSYKIQVQLLKTNLPLGGDPHSSNTTTIEIIGGGVAAIIIGVGAFAFFRRKNAPRNTALKENEPLYHVD